MEKRKHKHARTKPDLDSPPPSIPQIARVAADRAMIEALSNAWAEVLEKGPGYLTFLRQSELNAVQDWLTTAGSQFFMTLSRMMMHASIEPSVQHSDDGGVSVRIEAPSPEIILHRTTMMLANAIMFGVEAGRLKQRQKADA